MRSLQVTTPHMKCIYNCPFCISKSHKHDNKFDDNYHNNPDLWKKNLINVLKDNKELKYVVITGTNEPMQSKDCVSDIIKIVRKYRSDIQIEIQTRYYQEDVIYKSIDVVCYSISNYKLINKIKLVNKKNRFVFILTDSFNNVTLNDIIDMLPENVPELTFKILHNSNGDNMKMDKWIENHKIDDTVKERLKEDINTYTGNLSIRFDANCMDAKDRYKIFREDGNIYEDWG